MQLEKLVYEIPIADRVKQSSMLELKPNSLKRLFLALPAFFGWVLHAPLYLPVKNIMLPRLKETGHFDSIITGLTVLMYPVYLITIVSLLFILTKTWWMLLLLFLLPFTAWSYIQLKPQLDI